MPRSSHSPSPRLFADLKFTRSGQPLFDVPPPVSQEQRDRQRKRHLSASLKQLKGGTPIVPRRSQTRLLSEGSKASGSTLDFPEAGAPPEPMWRRWLLWASSSSSSWQHWAQRITMAAGRLVATVGFLVLLFYLVRYFRRRRERKKALLVIQQRLQGLQGLLRLRPPQLPASRNLGFFAH